MSVKSQQAVTQTFTTVDPETGALKDADSTPTGTLYVNGTSDAATVTVTKVSTGFYKAALTLPSLSAGDQVSLYVAATVGGVAGGGVVWADSADTVYVSEVKTETAAVKAKTDNLPASPAAVGSAMALTSAYDAAKSAASASDVASALETYDAPTKAELDSAVTSLATSAELEAVTKWLANKLVRTDNEDGTVTYVLYDDDNSTPLMTWVYTTASGTRAKAS